MIRYYKDFALSMSEVDYKPTLTVFALVGCNLNCYQCLNLPILNREHEETKGIEDVASYIVKNPNLFETIVFSGNEFLIAPMGKVKHDLAVVKSVTNKPIIIYTNGSAPTAMETLYKGELVDGFHTDIKLPWPMIDVEKDKALCEYVLGRAMSAAEVDNFIQGIVNTFTFNKGLNQLRTIRYPLLPKELFEDMQAWVESTQQHFTLEVPFLINDFVERG